VDRSVVDPERLRWSLVAVAPDVVEDPQAVRIVRAPGRVNLIGEHTDDNDGFVLPATIDLELRIAFVRTDERRALVTLDETGETAEVDLNALGPRHRTGRWIDYIAGVAWALQGAGVPVYGFRGLLASTLPPSAGLSSSAALELAAAFALTEPPGGGQDPMTLARLCQRTENEFVGARCGLIDQFAVAHGQPGAALFLDCRSLAWRPVPLPLEDHVLVVCHTGSTRRLLASEYHARREDCERAVAILARDDPAIRALRDVSEAMLPDLRGRLEERVYRRVEHVVRENRRVLATVQALTAGDLAAVGELFAESHRSLRDLYEVSSPELDALVEIAAGTPGVVAARMTGAGFGGCTVNLVARDAVARLRDRVVSLYPARTGLQPRVLVVEPTAGAGILGE
jgi:galactokinase